MSEREKIKKIVNEAASFHGHLGPFLVIGVRMGLAAKKALAPSSEDRMVMQAVIQTPLQTPFSCVIDGVQATTQCTVGNQMLKIENSHKIASQFTLRKSKTVKMHVHSRAVEELMKSFKKGVSGESLAWEIAEKPDSELFTVELSEVEISSGESP